MQLDSMRQRPSRGRLVIIELVRLFVVILLTAAGYGVGVPFDELINRGEVEQTRLITSLLGALVGYLLGGLIGRQAVTRADRAQARLQHVDAGVLVASLVGAALAGTVSFALLWPVLLLPAKVFTVPTAMAVALFATYFGGRLGATRAGDLSRFIGVRGRLEVTSPSRGGGTKVVDTSALIDGRLVEVARTGFLEGTLVVPGFVVTELQGIADAEEPRRRAAGRRGLDTLRTLQDENIVPVEVSEDDVPGTKEVDAKLAALAKQRRGALVTTDANLARVAEIAGLRVLNLHELADGLRPPVLPGDRLSLLISKEGREPKQGVGYLPDGTMVVVERAAPNIGSEIEVDITSVMQTRHGRMLFAAPADGE